MDYMDKKMLEKYMISKIDPDFEIAPSISGKHFQAGATKVNYAARPNEAIVQLGFPRVWFGVNVDNIYTEASINNSIYRAIICAQSEFDFARLCFILVVTLPTPEFEHRVRLNNAFSLAQRFNVGRMIVKPSGYSFDFNNKCFLRRKRGKFQFEHGVNIFKDDN